MFGQTMQEIRKSKNMTLKEAAGDAISISQLSRFENGKSVIPVDLFYEVLDNLNTTSEEFAFLSQLDSNKKLGQWFRRIEQYNNSDQLNQLTELREEIQSMRPHAYSWEQFLIYFIESILETYDFREDTEKGDGQKVYKAQQPVLDYLMQVENWGEMELRLYALFGFVLDVETTYFLMRTALRRAKHYLDIPSTKRLLHTILSNNFSTFIFHNQLKYAEETIQLFEEHYSENTEELGPHIDFLFNKGLLAFKKNKPTEGKKYCEQAISICQLFKQKDSEKTYAKRYKSWKENYHKEDFKELTIQVGSI